LPDGRLKNRQKTCGNPECQREWHRKKCAEWNKKNEEYFRTNYLQKKLEVAKSPEPNLCKSRLKTGKPIKDRVATQICSRGDWDTTSYNHRVFGATTRKEIRCAQKAAASV
jgi:hypothetical protein